MRKQLKLLSVLVVTMTGLLMVVSPLLFSVASATYVEGHITKDAVWTLVDSPFVVSKDVTVDPAVTLTIEPGVEVRFAENFSLFAEGVIYAVGTKERPIAFTSNKYDPQAGDWGTIKFSGTTQSTLAYCSVTYATNGSTVENGRLTIKNSIIANSLEAGISVTGNSQVTIQNNTLGGNADGIFLTGNSISGATITQNLILLNTQSGLHLGANAYSNLVILNNILSANNYGFYSSGNATTIVTNNSISYNGIGFFYDQAEDHEAHFNDIYGNERGMDVSEATVNATYNYWGDESGPYHASLNPNGKGDPVGGDGVNLDFIFFLTAPIGYINQRPTANLISDMKAVQTNQNVTFFATTSSDDRHVDQYYYNFGDGQNSGWTTLSVFVHKYSSVGTYNATLTVMDDFGVKSTNVALVRTSVQNLPPLKASLTTSTVTVGSGQQIQITIFATDGASPVAGANVTLFSIIGGSFAPSSGLTNSTGCFTAIFSAPNVNEKTYVRITATASKNSYADGSNHEYLVVLPPLAVETTTGSVAFKSGATASVSVHVTHNLLPISGATVTLASDGGGSFSPATATTDSIGDAVFNFTAPETTSQLNVTITATAVKSDYFESKSQTKLTVNPRILVVQVIVNPTVVESKATSNITVHVTEDSNPVEGAVVAISTVSGNFSATTGSTNSNGDLNVTFTAPQTTTQLNLTITANATKSGYASGVNQTKMVVNPPFVPQPIGVAGLPLTTILMIAIPIIVVVVVVILIKTKVIIIGREES